MSHNKEQALAMLKQLGLLKKRRTIVGEEREQILTMLRLLESESSNNQHVWTETWKVGNITYHLHEIGRAHV